MIRFPRSNRSAALLAGLALATAAAVARDARAQEDEPGIRIKDFGLASILGKLKADDAATLAARRASDTIPEASFSFDQVDRVSLELLPEGRARAVYVLSEQKAAPLDGRGTVETREPGFVERYVLAWLEQNVAGLEATQVVENIVIRRSGSNAAVERVRRLELAGTRGAVEAASTWLDGFVRANRCAFEIEVVVVEHPAQDADASIAADFLTEAEYRARRDDAEKNGGVLTAPVLTVYSGQRSNVSVLNQISFVSDFDLDVTPERIVLDPVVEVVNEGVILDVEALLDPGSSQIQTRMRLDLAALVRPTRTASVRVEDLSKFEFQIPVVDHARWTPDVLGFSDNRPAVSVRGLRRRVWAGDGRSETRAFGLLVHVRRVDLDAAVERVGRVTNADGPTGTILFTVPGARQDDVPVDARVRFVRDGSTTGRGDVRGFYDVGEGLTFIARLVDGATQAGDEVHLEP